MARTPPRSRLLTGPGIVAVAALLAACGSGGPSGTGAPAGNVSPPPPTRPASPGPTRPESPAPAAAPPVAADEIRGSVRDASGPVAGATVRIQATTVATRTDAAGRFRLSGLVPGSAVRLAAWAEGYYIAGGAERRAGEVADFELVPIPEQDTPGYTWLPAASGAGDVEGSACAGCHSAAESRLAMSLPFDEWKLDAHGGSAENPRFLSMYAGTDLAGRQSPPTRYVDHTDYGRIPLRPDPDRPYYGPGYLLDFPDAAGNCATCHVPAAAVADPYGTDVRAVTGVAAEGVTCDVCHKVWDVALDPETGVPDPGMPGILSIDFRRPAEGHQLFAGPYDDVAPGEDTFSPLQLESRFCSPCHSGSFWDVPVYDSYREWLASPYSDPATGRTCQSCHMPPSGATFVARPDKGGLTRDPATIAGHRMPGAADEALLRDAVTMTVEARRAGSRVVVDVAIVNDRTGHHVPTDSPLRQVILLVEANSPDGRALAQVEGPVLPGWTGTGKAPGHYAGRPGNAYAKVLEELWTEVWPTGAYWNPTRIRSDNRIPAFGTAASTYEFRAPSRGAVDVRVTLLFRRAFADLAESKGWDDPDIVMERAELVVRG